MTLGVRKDKHQSPLNITTSNTSLESVKEKNFLANNVVSEKKLHGEIRSTIGNVVALERNHLCFHL